MFCPPQPAPSPVPPRPPPPVPFEGISMDVDIVWKTHSLPLQGYYRCREANHLVKNCPHHLDIQRLTMKQREELIEDLMALKDAVEEEKGYSAPKKDFV